MPNGTVILCHYKEYMLENKDLSSKDRQMLFHFFHEIADCVNLIWKGKSFKGGEFSKVVTTSDEAFALFIMRVYDKTATKQDREKINGWEKDLRLQ